MCLLAISSFWQIVLFAEMINIGIIFLLQRTFEEATVNEDVLFLFIFN